MDKKVVVFTKPGCIQCDYTKKLLIEKGVPFHTADISESQWAYGVVERSGKTQLPLVMTPTARWWGFRPEKIRGLQVR